MKIAALNMTDRSEKDAISWAESSNSQKRRERKLNGIGLCGLIFALKNKR